jgi:hypothetical protein
MLNLAESYVRNIPLKSNDILENQCKVNLLIIEEDLIR